MKNNQEFSDKDFGLKAGDLSIILKEIKKYTQISEALIFGSRAMGNYKPGSDIDIALKGQDSFNIASKVFGILNDESPLPYEFDIISYEDISNPDFKKHIDEVGKAIL